MSASSYKNVGIASLIMMGSVFLSRAVGLVREMSIAYVSGAGHEVDAYQIGFLLPEVLNHILASGFLSVTFIPIFTRHMVRQREDEAWRSFSIILCVFGACAAAGTAVAMVFAPVLVALAAPGLHEPEVLAAAVRMTRIILPAQIAFFVGGLLMAVQFARERFFLPALAPLIYNLGIIACGLLLKPWLGVEGFAWGVLVGAFLGNFAVQVAGARRLGLRFRPAWSWTHPDLKEYVRLTLPLIMGLTMTFSTEVLFRFFGSYLPAGGIAVLNFSLRVMLILVGLFGQAVGTASFPTMARLAAENNLAELNRLLNRTLRYLALLIPVAGMLMVLSREVVRILFQRGRFDPAATTLTAEVLVWFLAGAFAFAAYAVVVRGYYATRNTLLPALFGTAAVLASIPVYFLGISVMGTSGVAAAVSLSGILQVAGLYHLWSRGSRNAGQGGVYRFYFKMGLLGVGMAAALAAFREMLLTVFDAASLPGSLAVATLVGVAFAGLMLLAGYGLKIPEITDLTGRLVRVIQRRLSP